MEIPVLFQDSNLHPIHCVEMHTTGEPTRIIYKGLPRLTGTLLEQRAQGKRSYDHFRKRLILEPRGHADMYGALLRPDTELTQAGDAHMGVLFMSNDGFSMMCGHATIALGRFLLDTHDKDIFPKRDQLKHDPSNNTVILNLHVPCGLLKVTVPTNEDGSTADPSRPVSFISVPSFAVAIQVQVPIPTSHAWPELGGRDCVHVDISYGGAFYYIVQAEDLGFPGGLRRPLDFEALNRATKLLKAATTANPDLQAYFVHPDTELEDVGYLYGIIVVDETLGTAAAGTSGVETGLCYFSDQQIDRSPTGGGVAARVALAYAKRRLGMRESWTYHSLVSNTFGGGFTGTVAQEVNADTTETSGEQNTPYRQIRVKVEGYAYYTGFQTFVVEEQDPIGEQGFMFQKLSS